MPSLTGTVETEFLAPTLLGEQVVPYRVLPAAEFVVPMTARGELLDGDNPRIDAYPGLAGWMRQAEAAWTATGPKMTLSQQIDHMKKLTQQVPARRLRVVYAASGMHACAALLTDERAIVEHAVYWAAVATEAEGHYLVGILNSPALTELVRPHMSYGKDERHIDKHVWKLPIPTFDANNKSHSEIAALARELTAEIAGLSFRSTNFVVTRKDLRAFLLTDDRGIRLNDLVVELLDADIAAPSTPAGELSPKAGCAIRTTAGSLGELAPDVQIDVDCEYDEAGRVYLWGALVTSDPTEPGSYIAFGDPESNVDEHELVNTFAAWLTQALEEADSAGRSVGWFYYGTTEAQQLRRLLTPTAADALLHRGVNLLNDVIRPNFYSPDGYGLKNLAGMAGASWRTPGATGVDTYDWIAGARAGATDAWTRLLEYNEDDTRATFALRQSMHGDDAPRARTEL